MRAWRDLGEERQLNLFEGSEEDWEQQPLPDGPITVGLDGGYVRAARKHGCFEVNRRQSVVDFRGEDQDEVPSSKSQGFVQTHAKITPAAVNAEIAGIQENQQLFFLSDGGENVPRA